VEVAAVKDARITAVLAVPRDAIVDVKACPRSSSRARRRAPSSCARCAIGAEQGELSEIELGVREGERVAWWVRLYSRAKCCARSSRHDRPARRLVALARASWVWLAVLGLIAFGLQSYVELPIDAVPDITNIQVQVLTNAPGLSPLEVEQLVTRPVELSMAGMPGATLVRSTSRSAVSAVTIIFRDDVDLAYARALVSQRLPAAREAIPKAANRPELGPMTTASRDLPLHAGLAGPYRARHTHALRLEIAFSLRSVPGVVEVNAWVRLSRQV